MPEQKQILIRGKTLEWWVDTGKLVALNPKMVLRRLSYNTSRFAADHASRFGYYDYPHHIIFLAGMAMSASTWMKNLLARIPGYYTRYKPMPADVIYNQDICDSAFRYVPEHSYTLFKTHLNPTQKNIDCIFRNGVTKVLVTHRDLRDVAVARYHRLVDFPKPKDADDFVDYRALGQEKAMGHSIEFVGKLYIAWIRGWFETARNDPDRYCITKFEELKKDTKGTFQKVLRFYDIELSDKKINEIIEAAKGKGNMEKNVGTSRLLPFGLSGNFRSGKIGNWKNEMSDAQIKRCKELFGDILIEFGYEKDLNW